MGRERYPEMNQLMITADGSGSNGSRVRLLKIELQKLADETGLTLRRELGLIRVELCNYGVWWGGRLC